MTNYTETINIVVNDSGVTKANSSLQTLKSSVKEINSTPIKIKFSGSNDFKSVISGYKNMIKTINSGDAQGINKVLRQFNRLQSTANKQIKINISEGNVKSIVSSMEKLTAEMKELSSAAKSVDLSKIGSGVGSLGSINTQLEQISTTLKEIKANSNIDIKVKQSGTTASGIQQTVRNTSGNTGNGHTANIYGFDADRNATYQAATSVRGATKGLMQMSEKFNVFGSNMAMLTSLMGVKSAKENLVDTPAKAEVNKYFAKVMQGDATGFSIYDTLDKATDELPISMQNVVQPLFGFKSATGATAQQINDLVPDFANLGAQVINMTGSEERAETAMLKLAYAIGNDDSEGRWEAVDQFGVNKRAIESATDENGNKLWDPSKPNRDPVGFLKAVSKAVGDAKDSMDNFNGMKQTVSKDFSRAGKRVWENFTGPILTNSLKAYDAFDKGLGGVPSMLLELGSAGLSLGSTLTQSLGSIGLVVANFGEVSGALKAIRKNGGGLREAFKRVTVGSYRELMGHPQDASYYSTAENPQLSSIDNKVGQIVKNDSNNKRNNKDSQGNTDRNSKRNKRSSNENQRYKTINKKNQSLHDALLLNEAVAAGEKTPSTTKGNKRWGANFHPVQSMRNKYNSILDKLSTSRDNAYDKAMNFHPMTSTKEKINNWGANQKTKINKWGKNLRTSTFNMKGFSKSISGASSALKSMGKGIMSVVTSGWMVLPLLLVVGAFSNYYSNALKKDEKVRQADERLNKAITKAKSDFVTTLGNIFQSLGWAESGGESGTYETLTNAINSVASWVEHLPFTQKPDSYYTNEQYKDNPQADPNLGYKQHEIDKVRWLDWLSQPIGMLADALKEVGATILDALGNTGGAKSLRDKDFTEEFTQTAQDKIEEIRNTDYLGDMRAKTLEKRNKENRDLRETNAVSETQKQGVERPVISQHKNGTGGESWLPYLFPKNNTTQAGGGSGGNIWSQITSFFSGGKGLGNAAQNSTAGQQPNMMKSIDASGIKDSIMSQLNQAFQTADLNSVGQSIMTSLTNSMNTVDFTPMGTTLATNLNTSMQTSLASTPIDLSSFFSNITSQLNSHNTEFNTAGNEGGSQYTSGFGTGIGGASGTASAEAGEILSALDISAEAYALGQAAGNAYQEGYRSSGGGDMHSPGKAARAARDEGLYILGFMRDSVSPIYSSAQQMGRSMANGFARTGTLGYNGVSFPSVNKENTAGFVMGNATGGGGVNYNTLNFNIEKIDSRDRAKEVAEFATQMLKWNNETAGRTTEV